MVFSQGDDGDALYGEFTFDTVRFDMDEQKDKPPAAKEKGKDS